MLTSHFNRWSVLSILAKNITLGVPELLKNGEDTFSLTLISQ